MPVIGSKQRRKRGMRAGILIVGSLLWDRACRREAWRQSRLVIDGGLHVMVPIHYGRRAQSRGNTFTMTFAVDGVLGQAVLVPCKRSLADVSTLVTEAGKLWKAEDCSAEPGSIGAPWGCVGVLFRDEGASSDWVRAWRDHFHRKVPSPVPAVGQGGLLGIAWPTIAAHRAADVDLILTLRTSPMLGLIKTAGTSNTSSKTSNTASGHRKIF